ncbi:reverse transcriptase domain-containing protein [Sphingorhabdus sp. SMR4y]|uniref:reverse transcriptase domain-containing protein n=1 Tax=Sphingorhabdus sp. SMR4y TaxID=2584094 RepID=UPI000B5CD9D2|nr:reverse transcriptase domain-containing protein [Sphingorhabdus sp. SMR4y]ASK88367.1 reverse transcriptase (RNA-dependent DNA polymerase) [Sphingorhabdus sp. SMR4y]
MIAVSDLMGRGEAVFGSHWNLNDELREEVGQRSRGFIRKLRSLKKCDRRQQRAAIERLLKSYDAKLIAFILAWNGKHPITRTKLDTLLDGLDPWVDCGEYIHPIAVPKDSGMRLTFSFGVKRRVLQKLVLLILTSALGQSRYEFARKGKGPVRALNLIKDAIQQKGGPRWYNINDIENFYGSVTRDRMKEIIPLPDRVIQNVIFLPCIREEKFLIEFPLLQAAQVGIPQGSLASPFIASKIMESILDKVSGYPKIVHGDDVIIGNDRECVAQANEGVVHALCAGHPAGPFKVKSEISEFGTPLDYLGYRVRKRPKKFGGGVRFTPSPKSFNRLETRMFERLSDSHPSEIEEREKQYRTSWMSAFSIWDRSKNGDDLVEINIGAHVVMPARRAAYAKHKAAKNTKSN